MDGWVVDLVVDDGLVYFCSTCDCLSSTSENPLFFARTSNDAQLTTCGPTHHSATTHLKNKHGEGSCFVVCLLT